jgi:RNA polymerase sigma-B factor
MGNSPARSENGLGPDATARLLRSYLADGDTSARARLIELYLPLVRGLARRHARGGETYEDLVQVGSIGLINAIDRFDLARGGELAAYAVPNIAGEMKRHLRDSGHTIRLPRGLAEVRGRVPAAREALTGRLGREPSPAELAAELRVSEQSLAAVLSAEGEPAAESADLTSRMADGFLEADERLALADAFEALDERERQIVHLRFVRDLDPEQVASELGMSRRNLSRQTEAALTKLRRQLEGGSAADPASAQRTETLLPGGSRQPKMPKMKSGPVRDGARYLDLPYHIVLVRDDEGDGGWTAHVEEFPGCEGHGDTPDEATRRARESMQAWISEALAADRKIPEPRGASTHSGRLMLRMPQSLHAELAQAAERDDVSLNQFITGSLASAVGWRQPGAAGQKAPEPEEPLPEPSSPRPGGRWTGRALVVNAVLLGLAALAAVALLIVVLTHG